MRLCVDGEELEKDDFDILYNMGQATQILWSSVFCTCYGSAVIWTDQYWSGRADHLVEVIRTFSNTGISVMFDIRLVQW